jgi:hypothetical protein
MLYIVGTDLEREGFGGSNNLFEIVEGISLYYGSDRPPGASGVHFAAQTGGCCFDPNDSVTGGGEQGARFKRELAWSGCKEGLNPSIRKILWDRNERWEITADGVIPMQVQPDDAGRRLMTQKDENGCVSELLDFIRETIKQFPAQQYILFICGHGGGPLWGFGEDERNDDEMIISSDICRMLPHILSITGKKLALVGYSSCFMSCPELLLAWSEGARNFLASETNSNVKGWLNRGMIYSLLSMVNSCCTNGTLTDEIFDEQILPAVIDKAFTDYIPYAHAEIISAFSLEEEKIRTFERSYREFTKPFIKRLFDAPVESFKAIMQARLRAQKIDEYSVDLGTFAKQIATHPYFSDIVDLDLRLADFNKSITDMTIKKAYTSGFDEDISGLLLFLPVTDSTTVNSNWEKYLFSHRKSDENGFKTWPFSGYEKPLPRPEDGRMGDFCPAFLSLKEGIWIVGGLFCAIRETGRLLCDPENGLEEVAGKLQDELSVCGISEFSKNDVLKQLPREMVQRKAEGLFDEESFVNVRIRCRYRKRKTSFTRNRGLGYLPTNGADPKQNFKWFYTKNADGTAFLLPVYKLRGPRKGASYDLFFTEEAELLTPVLTKSKIMMLYIHYKSGEDTGKITKIDNFSFASASLESTTDSEMLRENDWLCFLGSVAEGERYEMAFFDDRVRDFVVGKVNYTEGLCFGRGSISDIVIPKYWESMDILCSKRDIFNGETYL